MLEMIIWIMAVKRVNSVFAPRNQALRGKP